MTGILNALIAGVSGAVKDAYFNLVSLLLPGNGTNGSQNNTFLDGSTNNFTITRNGNTTQGTFSPFSQTGWGNYFDGSNAGLSVNVSGIAAGSSTFTLEMWVYLIAYPSTDAPFVDTRSSNAASTTAFQFGVYSTGAIKFYDGTETNLGGTVPRNQWTHIALVRNASNVVTPYINGTATGTTVSCTRNLSDNYFWICSVPSPSSPYLNTYVSNLRWVVGSAVYTSNFTPSTSPLTAITNTVLLTCQSNRFIDTNTQLTPKTITVNGSPSVVAFSPFAPSAAWSSATNGGSGYFDGNGDYLSSTISAISGTFTIEFWFYRATSGNNFCFTIGDSQTGGNTNAEVYIGSSGTVLNYWANNAAQITGSPAASGQWIYLAVTRDASNVVRLYQNGSQVGGTYTQSGTLSTAIRIGVEWYGGAGTGFANGYIGDFRVSNSVRTVTTVPTSPFASDASTVFLANFTNAGIYDATSKNDLETEGNAQISTTQSKWGGGSMYFDGTGDYLKSNVSTLDLYGFGGDFAIELWLYRNATGQTILVDSRPTGGGGTSAYYVLYVNTSNVLSWFVGGSVRITGTTTISNSTWYHIAIARSGSSTKMYLNGTQEGSTYTDSTALICASGRPYVGADANDLTSNLNGYIDDLRITKGNARGYTGSTITVPTAPFPVQ